jgi:hypothetical protein
LIKLREIPIKLVAFMGDGSSFEFEVAQMNVDFSTQQIDVTNFGSRDRTFIPGYSEAIFTFRTSGPVDFKEAGKSQGISLTPEQIQRALDW